MRNSWHRRSHLRQQNGTAAVSQRSMKMTGRMWHTTVCRLTHMIKPTQRQRANRAPLTRSLAYLSRHADGDVELRVPFKFLRPQKKRMQAPQSSTPAASAPAPPSSSQVSDAAASAPAQLSCSMPTGSDVDGLTASNIVSGKRKVRPTTVMIDGHAVKRQNNYNMEEGEGSVWDRELSSGGAYADPAFAYRERKAPTQAAVPPKPKAQPVPRVQTAEEKERLLRNEEMRAAKQGALQARLRFLEPHRHILAHFGALLPQPSAAEQAASARDDALMGGGVGGFLEDASIVQPKEIQVEMRDYQLRGLRWLVGMHKCGVNAILADEMGLGKTLQTIAFLAHLKFVEGVPGPHLVIVPLSVLSCLLYTSPSPRDRQKSRMPSSA